MSLLQLPRELRDRILILAISTPVTAPTTHIEAGDRVQLQRPLPFIRDQEYFHGSHVKYPPPFNRIANIPTLLVNRQLHDETTAAIELLPTKQYVLDVMLVELEYLWPTWLSIPDLASTVDRVHTTFRIDPTGTKKEGFRGGDGGPPPITWAFYSLLAGFLKFGPGLNPDQGPKGSACIRNLDIEVEKTDDLDRDVDWGMKHLLVDSEYLTNFIISDLGALLGMGYHTAACGGILFERIGNIRVIHNGEVCREWDLARELNDLQFHDSFGRYPRDQRPEIFKKWKSKAYKTREKLGLPVIVRST